jgi:siderophore-iron reductase FhuF
MIDFPTLLARPALAELRAYCTFHDDGRRRVSGQVLLDPGALALELADSAALDRQAGRRAVSTGAALSAFAQAPPGRNLHSRAYASEWSIYLAGTLLYLVAVPALLARAVPTLSLASLRFDPQGYPKQVVLAPALTAATDLRACYGTLLEEVLPAMVEGLHQASGVSRDILWVNMASRIDSVFLGLAEHLPSLADAALAERAQLLESPRSLDGLAANPYRHAFLNHHDVHPLAPPVLRVRRNCCLRYAFEDHFKYCTPCPLLKKRPMAERQAHFERLAEHDHDHDHDHDHGGIHHEP